MGTRIALMVRPGRRMGPLPTGAVFLIAELADGLTRRDLDEALERRTLEITDFPADPEAVVGLPESEDKIAYAQGFRDGLDDIDTDSLLVPENKQETEAEPPAVSSVEPEPAVEEKKLADFVTGPSAEDVHTDLEEAKTFDEEVRDLVEANSHKELCNLAKKEKVTFSARGTKEEIAREIVEARRASS